MGKKLRSVANVSYIYISKDIICVYTIYAYLTLEREENFRSKRGEREREREIEGWLYEWGKKERKKEVATQDGFSFFSVCERVCLVGSLWVSKLFFFFAMRGFFGGERKGTGEDVDKKWGIFRDGILFSPVLFFCPNDVHHAGTRVIISSSYYTFSFFFFFFFFESNHKWIMTGDEMEPEGQRKLFSFSIQKRDETGGLKVFPLNNKFIYITIWVSHSGSLPVVCSPFFAPRALFFFFLYLFLPYFDWCDFGSNKQHC